jgi:hypothetical protein
MDGVNACTHSQQAPQLFHAREQDRPGAAWAGWAPVGQ